ncbi:MAG: hypothetical protein IPL28_17370 [Chloroflexi bacterium]|nr:hypothetical protein [Chloroflexota bacterium]
MRKLFLIPFTFGLAVVASWLWYSTLTAAALPSTPVPTYNLTELAAEQAPTLTQLTIGEKSTLPEQRMGQLPLPSHGRAPHTTTPADLSAYVVNSRDLPDCFNFTATAVITIAPNTPVNTCYFIANTSADLPLTTHTLTTTLDGFLLDEYPLCTDAQPNALPASRPHSAHHDRGAGAVDNARCRGQCLHRCGHHHHHCRPQFPRSARSRHLPCQYSWGTFLPIPQHGHHPLSHHL